jgi:hypothetical protein
MYLQIYCSRALHKLLPFSVCGTFFGLKIVPYELEPEINYVDMKLRRRVDEKIRLAILSVLGVSWLVISLHLREFWCGMSMYAINILLNTTLTTLYYWRLHIRVWFGKRRYVLLKNYRPNACADHTKTEKCQLPVFCYRECCTEHFIPIFNSCWMSRFLSSYSISLSAVWIQFHEEHQYPIRGNVVSCRAVSLTRPTIWDFGTTN